MCIVVVRLGLVEHHSTVPNRTRHSNVNSGDGKDQQTNGALHVFLSNEKLKTRTGYGRLTASLPGRNVILFNNKHRTVECCSNSCQLETDKISDCHQDIYIGRQRLLKATTKNGNRRAHLCHPIRMTVDGLIGHAAGVGRFILFSTRDAKI